MTKQRVHHAAAAAAIVDATGEAKRLEPVRVPRLEKARLLEVLTELDMMPTGGSAGLTSHVTLTAQTPWVDGKGYLTAINPRTFFADGPGMHFIPEPGQPTGRLEVWLNGLDAGAGYLARLEIGTIGSSPFDVRAVTLGAGVVWQTFQTGAGFHTLLLQFPSGDGGLGLIRIECADWSFYEAEVSRFDA